MLRFPATWMLLAPVILPVFARSSAPAEKVQLTIATLHAAALTSPRSASDSTDTPYFVVEVGGASGGRSFTLPAGARQSIRLDGALAARPLTELDLASGDSVRVRVSVMEQPGTNAGDGAKGTDGARDIGSVSLLVVNDGGTIYWRRLECLASCKVLTPPAAAALPPTGGQPVAGTVELNGNGGVYHLALRATRAP